jgi:hypothetical protein
MKVRNENVRRERTVAEFALQLPAEHAESGATIEDVNTVADADFDAGGVPSIAHVLGLWSGCGTPYSPELDPHRLPARARGRPLGLFLGVSSDAQRLASIAGLVQGGDFAV